MPEATQTTRPAPAPRVYTIPQAAAALGIGRSSIYALRKAGRLGFAHVGGRAVIPVSELDQIVADLEAEARASRGAAA
jgi:excisionase family DNA binding protein